MTVSETTAPEPPAPEPAAPEPAEAGKTTKLSKKRRILIWVLVVLGSVLLLVSILTVWVQRQVLDNNSWRHASEQLIQDPKVQETLSVYLTNQIFDNVDVTAALQQRLPANLDPLAPGIAGALRGAAPNTIKTLLERPRFQQLWVNASSAAQEKLVNVLEDKTGHGISTGNGTVTIDLKQLLTEITQKLGLPGTLVAHIPPDTGVITVMKSSNLRTVQKGVKVANFFTVFLFIVVLGLFAAAIALARGMRRATLRNIAFAFIVVGLIVLLVRRFTGTHVITALTTPEYDDTVSRVWVIGSAILGDIGRASIFYGVIALVGALLAGPTRIATRVRRWIAPTIIEQPGVAWGAVAGLFLLLVLWGPTHALTTWWGILILGGLLALGFEAFRRAVQREYPPGSFERVEVEAESRPPSGGSRSPSDELARLNELHAAGQITDDEFAQAKRLVLT
jgi:hypothetical protein